MELRTRQIIALAALLITLSVRASGQQGGGVITREAPPRSEREVERSAVNFTAPWRPGGVTNTDTKIIGTVVDIRQIPVAGARLRLRNLESGNVEQTVDANEQGEYAFDLEEPGTYVVEMLMVEGYVVALSNAGSIGRFETMNTVVQIPGRWDEATRRVITTQNATNFLGMSAETTMTAATIQIAVNNNVTPQNPGVPMSPQ